MKKKLKIKNAVIQLFTVFGFCFEFSCKASFGYTAFRVFLGIVSPLSSILSAYQSKLVINNFLINPDDTSTIYLNVILFGMVALVSIVAQRLNLFVSETHNQLLEVSLKKEIINKTLTADLSVFDSSQFLDELNLATQNPEIVQQIVSFSISTFSSIISVVGIFSVLSTYNIVYAIIISLLVLPQCLVNGIFTKSLYNCEVSQTQYRRKRDYIYQICHTHTYAFSIRAHQIEKKLETDFSQYANSLIAEKKQLSKRRMKLKLAFEIPAYIILLFLCLDVASLIITGEYTAGDFSYIAGIIYQLWTGLSSLILSIAGIYDCKLRISSYQNFQRKAYSAITEGNATLDEVRTVEFQNVYFKYPGSTSAALSNVSFKASKGECIAIVGLNGSGKSTVTKLLLRMYTPDSGEILINNKSICEYPIAELRKQFSVYQQNEPNYNFSIRENIDFLGMATSDKEIECALSQAGALDFVKLMPWGIDSFIGRTFDENGYELSGGNSQKLALARTFFCQSPAIILDEPLSSLDPAASNELIAQLHTLKMDHLILFISHDINSLKIADKIMVMECGQVVDFNLPFMLKKPFKFDDMCSPENKIYE